MSSLLDSKMNVLVDQAFSEEGFWSEDFRPEIDLGPNDVTYTTDLKPFINDLYAIE